MSDVKEVVTLLQRQLMSEYQQWDMYTRYAPMTTGSIRDSLIEHFKAHAKDEETHIDVLQRYLISFGVRPTAKRLEVPTLMSGATNEQIIKMQMTYEEKAVENYGKLLALLEEIGPTWAGLRIDIETILASEQEHVHDFKNMKLEKTATARTQIHALKVEKEAEISDLRPHLSGLARMWLGVSVLNNDRKILKKNAKAFADRFQAAVDSKEIKSPDEAIVWWRKNMKLEKSVTAAAFAFEKNHDKGHRAAYRNQEAWTRIAEYGKDKKEINELVDSDMFQDPYLQERLAENPYATTRAFEELAKSARSQVRINLVKNPNTPDAAFMAMVKSWHPSEDYGQIVRLMLERTKKVSPTVLKKIAVSTSNITCMTLAENNATPPEVLALLAKNKSSGIRYRVAKNPNTTEATIKVLLKDPEPIIQGEAKKRLRTSTASLRVTLRKLFK